MNFVNKAARQDYELEKKVLGEIPPPGDTPQHGIAWIGDSIQLFGGENKTSYPYVICDSMNHMYRMRGVFAVGGYSPSDAEEHLLPQVLGLSPLPRYCVLGLGTNGTWAGSDDVSEFSTLERMVNTLIEKGVIPVLCTIPPNTGTGSSREKVLRWNAKLSLLRGRKNCLFLDIFEAVSSPLTASWVDGSYHSDGVHPTHKGHGAITKYALSSPGFINGVKDSGISLAKTNIASIGEADYNMFVNSGFFTDANGDGVADGLNGDATNASIIITPGERFNWQRNAKPEGATSTGTISTGSPIFTPGKEYEVGFRYKVSLDEDAPDVHALWSFAFATGSYQQLAYHTLKHATCWHPEEGSVSVRLVAPEGTERGWVVLCGFPGSTAPTKDVWAQCTQMTIRDVTALES